MTHEAIDSGKLFATSDGWRYQVTLNLTGTMFLMGSFNVSLCGKMECSPQYVLHSGFIHSGRTYSSFVDVDMDIYPVIKVEFTWQRDIIDVISPTLGVTAMAVQYGPSGTMFHFCGNGVTEEGNLQTLESCNVNSRIKS
ncbi:pancreatic lipase-related protein 2-like [Hyla sarda]|uniref:pancreatic lipase-related protein 2-like n=1 Tax=Hyla sarda TaxID=327740 RepID=UPI0024C3368D|nr:pancreatic lipase-related protein 2-like [Hyla sarda]